jgi:very-short-patch-repair endonuclease
MPNPVVPEQLRAKPFTTSQAAACGITRAALKGAQWRHIFRSVWVHVDVPDTRAMRLDAVRLVLGAGAFVCGLTAAWIYGIDVQDRRAELVWVGCRNARRLRTRVGCLVREISVEDSDLQLVDGILMTTELRTVFDCSRWLSLIEAVVVADAIAHSGAITPEDLAAYTAKHRGLRGVRQSDAVLDHIEPLSESPMESRVRVRMVLSGLPRPTAQIVVNNLVGQFVARGDLGYEEARLIIEYDGAFHWEQRRADDLRRDAMRRLGWTVLVLGADDYYNNPGAMVTRIARELARRAA